MVIRWVRCPGVCASRLYFLLHIHNRSPDVGSWMSCPRLCTPGDGRNAPQGTDLPRAVGEKRRQRHFGILWRSAQSETFGLRFCVLQRIKRPPCEKGAEQKKSSPKGGFYWSINNSLRRRTWRCSSRRWSASCVRQRRSTWLPRPQENQPARGILRTA